MMPRKRLFENNITNQAEHQALGLGAQTIPILGLSELVTELQIPRPKLLQFFFITHKLQA